MRTVDDYLSLSSAKAIFAIRYSPNLNSPTNYQLLTFFIQVHFPKHSWTILFPFLSPHPFHFRVLFRKEMIEILEAGKGPESLQEVSMFWHPDLKQIHEFTNPFFLIWIRLWSIKVFFAFWILQNLDCFVFQSCSRLFSTFSSSSLTWHRSPLTPSFMGRLIHCNYRDRFTLDFFFIIFIYFLFLGDISVKRDLGSLLLSS